MASSSSSSSSAPRRPADYEYDWELNPLDLGKFDRDKGRYRTVCPGIKTFRVDPPPEQGGRARDLCLGFSSTVPQLVFLFTEGRETKLPVYLYLSAPYMSHIPVPQGEPEGWYLGGYTRVGKWFDDQMIANEVIRDTGKKCVDGWGTELPIFELLLKPSEVVYTCEWAECNKTELMWVGANGDRYKQCSRCKLARYCSTKCQSAAWKKHKLACPYMAARDLQGLESSYRSALKASAASGDGPTMIFAEPPN